MPFCRLANDCNYSVQCGVVSESAISINECDNKIYQSLTDFNLVEQIKDLFKVEFSPVGSNKRMKEESIYMMFVDFLYNCAGK